MSWPPWRPPSTWVDGRDVCLSGQRQGVRSSESPPPGVLSRSATPLRFDGYPWRTSITRFFEELPCPATDLRLTDIDLQQSIRMIVTPAPVSLLIVVLELGKRLVFTMVFLRPHAVGSIFVTVPLMVVVMLCVVITRSRLPISRQHCEGCDKRDAQ